MLNLAATYGMAGKAAGEKLGFEGQDARIEGDKLLDSFFKGFPAIYTAIEESKKKLKEVGYVEGLLGRRRNLPWINDANYVVEPLENKTTYNPILICNTPKPKSYSCIFWENLLEVFKVLNYKSQCGASVTDSLKKAYAKATKSENIAAKLDMKMVRATLSDEEFEAAQEAGRLACKYSDEVDNDAFDLLYKLAANPSLWDKPTITKEYLAEQIAKKSSANRLAAYVRSTSNRYGTVLTKDKTGSYIILTNKERIQRSIQAYFNYISRPDRIPEPEFKKFKLVNIDADFQIPTEPILIRANTGRKAQAERQCFNARIQGSAATLTKLAMLDIAADQQMKDMQAKLIIPVHDELLVECPAYYADQVAVRLPELMCNAAVKADDPIPQACDPDIGNRWYGTEMAAHILDDFNKLIEGNPKKGIKPISKEEATKIILEENEEFPAESVLNVLHGKTEELIFE